MAAALNTGLMWQKTPDLKGQKTFREALAGAERLRLGGHADWRLPTIKELYSLIDFNGNVRARPPRPYIDTRFFDFAYGDEGLGQRRIDARYWSSSEYVGLTMRGSATVFGVHFVRRGGQDSQPLALCSAASTFRSAETRGTGSTCHADGLRLLRDLDPHVL